MKFYLKLAIALFVVSAHLFADLYPWAGRYEGVNRGFLNEEPCSFEAGGLHKDPRTRESFIYLKINDTKHIIRVLPTSGLFGKTYLSSVFYGPKTPGGWIMEQGENDNLWSFKTSIPTGAFGLSQTHTCKDMSWVGEAADPYDSL